jgi:glycosyltransferase involved in cell wall biosynthesis
MTEDKLVSVVIPTYNRAGMIGGTIENVFEQTYKNIELIVVDDGSTDGTSEVLASYGEKIRWGTQKNAGASAARNTGIRMARGEIVAFQDSDDLWHPTKIERQVSLLERAGEQVVCCLCDSEIQCVDGSKVTSFAMAPLKPPCDEGIWKNVAEVLTTRFVLFNQAVAVRRSALERTGGFDESLECQEDYELSLRLALEGPWAIIRTPLVIQRQGMPNSLSRRPKNGRLFLAEGDVSLREGILKRVASRGENPRVEQLMRRQLRSAERVLKGLKLEASESGVARLVGQTYLGFERFRGAVERRMPGYPQMEVVAA